MPGLPPGTGGDKIPLSVEESRGSTSWCETNQISLSTGFILGKLYILADKLSRGHLVLPTEWSIAKQAFGTAVGSMGEAFGGPVFATKFNNRLPLYFSPIQ